MAEMVADKLVDIAYSWLSEKCESSRQLKDRCELLKETLNSLLAKKEENEEQVQRHRHKDTTSPYKYWTNRVSKIAAEANELINTYDGQRIPKWKIWKRSRISEKIAKMHSEIVQLESKCPRDFLDKMPEPVLKEFDVPQIMEYPTLQGCLNSILGWLKNSNIKAIGVYGTKGVGKTTILRNLNNNEEVANLFGMVIYTRVGSAQTIDELQRGIAKRLMVDNEAMESTGEVAAEIRMKLEKKNYLLILDDIVNPIELEKLGIPHNNNGSKVVMATQFPHVFKSNKVQRRITVEKLESNDEAWKMFRDIAGEEIDFRNVKPTAQIVCRRCSRLPLLINIIASAFKLKESASSWRDGLEDLKPWPELQYQGVKELYLCLRPCYDELKDVDRQKCFLYTSLYPADSEVYSDYLVECWAAHGFLGDVNNTRRYQNARDRGNAILEHLIRASLLEKGKGMKYVRMNDCIKQFALHISSRLETWQMPRCESRIAQKLRAPPTIPDRNMLVTLLLQKNPELVAIAPEFFRNMSNLILLDLYGTGIDQLPSSMSELTNLKGLYLNDCRLLIMLPMEIESLQSLEVLDIRGSGVTFIPSHLKYLTNLRCLRISYGTNHCIDENVNENVKANHDVISGLHKLEELVIEVISYTQWSNDAEHVIQQVASLTNLSMLVCSFPSSSILQIFLENSESWRNHMQFNSFRFFVGCESSKCHQIVDSLEYGIDNYMKYYNGETNDDLAVTHILPRTDAFELVCHKDIRSLSSWVEPTTLNGIRSFLIERCNKMQTIVAGDDGNFVMRKAQNGCIIPNLENLCLNDATNSSEENRSILNSEHPNLDSPHTNQTEEDGSILSTLEHLYLDNLLKLKWVFRGPLHPKTLSKLKTLKLTNCPELKTIFFRVAIEDFSQLQKLTIQDCHCIGEIINVNEREKGSYVLPKLEMLVLDGLPNLSIICKDEILAWPSLVSLHIRRCPQLKTLPFGMEDATNLRFIKGEQQWWNSLVWTKETMEWRDFNLNSQPKLISLCLL